MKNSRTYIFSYAPIPKLMPRHYITDTRQKNFIAASRRSKTTITPKSRSTAEWPAWGQKKQRLTRAEWKAQKKHAMKVAAAESAVLDAAAQRETNAAKQERANADAAALLAKRSAKRSKQ